MTSTPASAPVLTSTPNQSSTIFKTNPELANAPAAYEYEDILIVEDVCLFTQDTDNIAFIDSACPTTVAGEDWLKKFVKGLPTGRKVKISTSDRMYKFGGG